MYNTILNTIGFVGVWIFTLIGVFVSVAPLFKYLIGKSTNKGLTTEDILKIIKEEKENG